MQETSFNNLMRTLLLTGCHFDTKPAGWSYPRHHHYLFELLYCIEGEVLQEVGDVSFPLGAGQWLLIRAGVPHSIANPSASEYRYFNLHFDFDDEKLREGLCKTPYVLLQAAEAESLGLNGLTDEIGNVLLGVDGGVREIDPFRESVGLLRLQALVLELAARFAELAIAVSASEAVPAAAASPTVGSATLAHAIEERLRVGMRSGITLREIASSLGVSTSRCAKVFADVYGHPPRKYQSRLMLNEAKQLLLGTTKSISEIADDLGFESLSQFSRQFRRWTGQAPTNFRPRHIR